MKCLTQLFPQPSPNSDSVGVMSRPVQFEANELEAIRDALTLLIEKRPDWRKYDSLNARAKVDVIRQAWRRAMGLEGPVVGP